MALSATSPRTVWISDSADIAVGAIQLVGKKLRTNEPHQGPDRGER